MKFGKPAVSGVVVEKLNPRRRALLQVLETCAYNTSILFPEPPSLLSATAKIFGGFLFTALGIATVSTWEECDTPMQLAEIGTITIGSFATGMFCFSSALNALAIDETVVKLRLEMLKVATSTVSNVS